MENGESLLWLSSSSSSLFVDDDNQVERERERMPERRRKDTVCERDSNLCICFLLYRG